MINGIPAARLSAGDRRRHPEPNPQQQRGGELMAFQLRDYQREAVDATLNQVRNSNGVVN
ncbi:hypothetical protein [Marinobacterium arenosum]|uniref:hypothetical protein n=1 Tax=Marinobacterium arenosum TaxID=2862496 RepID=UPI001C955B24|nr:hypothetical protein [Marinobacterium arenosum]MBY4677341.1 hypothetical protein [Marinobacterium arenosum]